MNHSSNRSEMNASDSRRITALGLATVILAGCVGPDVRPSADSLAKASQIYVVPMQSPPLELSEWSFATEPGREGALPPPAGLPPKTQGVATGAFFVSRIPAKPDDVEARLKEAQSKLDALPRWNPTIGIAQEAVRLLSGSGRAATAMAEVRALPEADSNLLQGKELPRLLAWYNSDALSTGYENLAGKEGAVVAEISMRYGALTADALYVEVFVKLINPRSGELIGRTRRSIANSNIPFPHLPPMNQALADDAKQLKDIVASSGNLYMRLCLQDLGFLSSSAPRR